MVKQSAKFTRLFIKSNRDLQAKHKVDVCPHVVVLDTAGREIKVFPKREMISFTAGDFAKELGTLLGEKPAPTAAERVANGVRRGWMRWPW